MTTWTKPIINIGVAGARGENLYDTVRRLGLGGCASDATDAEAALAYADYVGDNASETILGQTVVARDAAETAAASAGADLWSRPVASISNTPDATPTVGMRRLVGTSPTGAWASYANQVTEYFSDGWHFSGSPAQGQGLVVQPGIVYVFGTAWQAVRGHASIAGSYANIALLDAACVTANVSWYLDLSFSLSQNTTYSAPIIGAGGIITRGAYTLSGDFWAPPDVQMFDAAGTGAITLTGKQPEVHEKWFGVARDGATNDTAAAKAAILASGGRVLVEGVGTSVRTGWTYIVPPTNCTIQGAGPAATKDDYTLSANVFSGVLNMTNAGLTLRDLGVKIASSLNYGCSMVLWAADDLLIENCDFDGGMADNGTALTTGVNDFVHVADSGTFSGLRWIGGKAHDGYTICQKINASTAVIADITMRDIEVYNMYGDDIGHNSPNGSQTNIIVEGCNLHDNKPLLLLPRGNMGIAFASGTDIKILNNIINGNYEVAIHLEEKITDFLVAGNSGTVTTSGIDLRPAAHNTGGTEYWPTDGAVYGNIFTQSGTPLGPITAGYPNAGVLLAQYGSGFGPCENVDVFDNTFIGSGFGAGVYSTYPQQVGTKANKIHSNTFIDCAVGMYFPEHGAAGGIEVYGNITDGCATHIKAANVYFASHKFLNLDPAASTSVAMVGVGAQSVIAIGQAEFAFSPLSVAPGTQDYACVRLGSGDILGGVANALAVAGAVDRMGVNYYSVSSWDGSTATLTSQVSKDAGYGSISCALAKKTIGTADYLCAVATNGIGTSDIGAVVTLSGLYMHGGV